MLRSKRFRPFIQGYGRRHAKHAPVQHVPVGEAETATADTLRILLPVIAVFPDRSDDVRAQFLLPPLQNPDVGRVSRGEVISVRTVLQLQFPVGLEGKGDLTGYKLQAIGALVGNEIEQLGGLAKVFHQRRDVCRQTTKQETTIVGKLRQRHEPVIVLIEGLRIAPGRLPFHRLVPARAVERPAVVRTDEQARVALSHLRQARSLVRTGVYEASQDALTISLDEDRTSPGESREKVVCHARLAFQSEEYPAALEQSPDLGVENALIGEDCTAHAEHAFIDRKSTRLNS